MIVKTNLLDCVHIRSNDVNSNSENIIAINLNLFHFFLLENC